MTTLHPIEIRILQAPGWCLRVLLATVISLALTTMPLPIAGLALWLVALPYMVMTEKVALMLVEKHRALREAVAERERYGPRLAECDARIMALEADLARARSDPMPRPETAEQVLYQQVGLHPRAPEFLLVAARRAFRTALHPDRHPRHSRLAHDRYVRAESVFEEIMRARA